MTRRWFDDVDAASDLGRYIRLATAAFCWAFSLASSSALPPRPGRGRPLFDDRGVRRTPPRPSGVSHPYERPCRGASGSLAAAAATLANGRNYVQRRAAAKRRHNKDDRPRRVPRVVGALCSAINGPVSPQPIL